MSYNGFGKRLLERYGFVEGEGLGRKKTGITEALYPMSATFDEHSVIIFKAIYSKTDRERCDLIKQLSQSLSDEGRARKIFFPSGLCLRKLQYSK
jgi:hypothetical protein